MTSVLALPVLPLAGFVFAGTLGKGAGKAAVALVCCGVMAAAFLFAVFVVLGNLIADVLYAVVDPRIRYD